MVPSGAGGRTRPLGNVGTIGAVPGPRTAEHQETQPRPQPLPEEPQPEEPEPEPRPVQQQEPDPSEWAEAEVEFGKIAYEVFTAYTKSHQDYPSAEVLDIHLSDVHNVHHPRSAALLRRLLPGFKQRFDTEMTENHIA
jgi:hypothetical protein